MEKRFHYTGTGGELFKHLLVGSLLTLLTLGVYAPWLYARTLALVYARTTYGPTRSGEVQLEFSGSGSELFLRLFLGSLVLYVSFGLYTPWFAVDLGKYLADNSSGRAQDGTVFRLQLQAAGGDLFKPALGGWLLTLITAGLYGPWFICQLQRMLAQRTLVLANNAEVGRLEFKGEGAGLFGVLVGGYLLTLITVGIYAAWMQVGLARFQLGSTRATVGGATWMGDFSGSGGELFGRVLVGYILGLLTVGIYWFWFLADLVRWGTDHTSLRLAQADAAMLRPQTLPGGHRSSG